MAAFGPPCFVSGALVHVHHLLYEPRPSGISRHVEAVVRMLPDLRHTVSMPTGLTPAADALRALGAEVGEVEIGSKVLPRAALRSLPLRLRAVGADLLHLHALETGPFGLIASRLAGVDRVVFTPQTLEIRKKPLLPLLRRVVRLGGRRRIRAWVAVAAEQAEALTDWAPRERIHLVPNAAPQLPPAPDQASARRALGWPTEALVVACVGRLAPQKDPWTFAQAARDLPGVWGVLVGAGPLEAALAPLLDAAPNLRRQGYVERIEQVYAAADVICLPSLWEGLPYALLEALAAGKPVVASQIPGNVDLVQHERTGLLFPPGDVGALRRALARLAADANLRATLAAAGRARIEADYTEAAIAPRQRRVYEAALG